MKNAIEQLAEALDILTDYPSIEDILDIEGAKTFLDLVSRSNLTTIPDFKKIDSKKIDTIIKESKASIEDWVEALKKINGIYVTTEGIDDLIGGAIARNLTSLKKIEDGDGTDEDEILFDFRDDNEATFGSYDSPTYGSWEEIYALLIKHSNEHLTIPAIQVPLVEKVRILVLKVYSSETKRTYYEEVSKSVQDSVESLATKNPGQYLRHTYKIVKDLIKNNYSYSYPEIYYLVDGIKINGKLYCDTGQVISKI